MMIPTMQQPCTGEFAIKFRDFSTFACLDDKHRVKIGDPGSPLAAVERGRRVLVQANTTFEVSDHDFSKFSVIPSVTLLVDIPTEISESWYHGLVNVKLLSSSPLHFVMLRNSISSCYLRTCTTSLFSAFTLTADQTTEYTNLCLPKFCSRKNISLQ